QNRPSKGGIEDREWRMDGGSRFEDGTSSIVPRLSDQGVCNPQTSILDPQCSILHLRSSILHPLSCIFHNRADVTKAHDVIAERESSVITHFLGATNKSAERDPREHAAYTYALHPDLRKSRKTQPNA